MDVDDGAKPHHPQGAAELIGVGGSCLEDLVHMVDGVLNRGSCEEVLLPQHLDDAFGDDVPHGLDPLLQSGHDLAVDIRRFYVSQEVILGDGVEGLTPDHHNVGPLALLAEHKVGEQRVLSSSAHPVHPPRTSCQRWGEHPSALLPR